MKHIFILTLVGGLMLGGCASSLTENRESRSTTYVGQTTWDLYENFGVPTKAKQLSPNEFEFYYHREAITRDWTRLYYDFCDTTFYVVDDRVVDWAQSGNQCRINVAEAIRDTSGRLARTKGKQAAEEENYSEEAYEDAYPYPSEYEENPTLF